MPYTYKYPRPALAVDCVVFGFDEGDLKVLLVQRKFSPFKNKWAFPGGFVQMNETLDDAARRELEEETSIRNLFLEQLYTFSDVDRDPRERVISVGYYSLVKLRNYRPKAASDARQVGWFPVGTVPELGFDHDKILQTAVARLQSKVRYQPIGFELLPTKFTLSELQHVYEVILDREFDKRNFRKKFLKMKLLRDLRETQTAVAHRAARLYSFDDKKYEQLKKRGFNFEI
jgi:8-oxo-dGTP diphosphatase